MLCNPNNELCILVRNILSSNKHVKNVFSLIFRISGIGAQIESLANHTVDPRRLHNEITSQTYSTFI